MTMTLLGAAMNSKYGTKRLSIEEHKIEEEIKKTCFIH